MDKAFENMDKRFKNIEAELNYKYDSKLWNDVEGLMGDTALDSAFVKAVSSAGVSAVDFDGMDDAFLDSAFLEGSDLTKNNYQSSYFKDFKASEFELYQDTSFLEAAALSSAIYQPEFWNDADVALQKEGLHHEYKTDYWKEAEKLLLKDERIGFFLRWGSVATVLLLLSFVGIQFNQSNLSAIQLATVDHDNRDILASNNRETNNSNTNTELLDNAENTFLNRDGELKNSDLDNTPSPSLASNTEKAYYSLPKGEAVEMDKQVNKLIEDKLFEGNINNDNPISVTNSIIHKIDRSNEFYLSQNSPNSKVILNTINKNPISLNSNILSVKIAKGLGNDFGIDKGIICPRNSLFIDYRLSPLKRFNRISFGLDLGFYHMNLDNFEFEKKYSVYHIEGSVNHTWYKVTYKDLVFVSASFNTYIDLGKVSKLRLGLGVDQLLTSRIGMEYQVSKEAEKINIGNDWGLNRGINTFDLNFGLGYEVVLNSKFSFLIDTKIGAVDKTNNDYLHNKKSDRDIAILFGLKYNIFSH